MDRTSSARQPLEDFRKSLAQPQETGGGSGEAAVGSNRQETKVSMAGRRTLLEGSSLRKNVREQVTQLLRQNHVEITADIRKALPSRRAPGDPQRLSQLLGNAAMHLEVHDFASLKPHLQFEIDKLASAAASGNPASLEGFLPDGSGTAQKALLDLLRPAFEAQANDMAAQAFEKFARGLMFGKSINEAMDQAFEDLNGQFRSLKPGGEFHEGACCLPCWMMQAPPPQPEHSPAKAGSRWRVRSRSQPSCLCWRTRWTSGRSCSRWPCRISAR